MLSIPFLTNYIEKVVKVQIVADNVDWLNYYLTSLLLAFFSLAISAKQYFGSPIQCWVPNEFKGGWEKYAEDYCFIANSYHVPEDEDIMDHHRGDHLSYYRWVPIVLALQAVFFFLPNWLWSIMHKQTAINPRCYLEEAEKCKALCGEERDKQLSSLAEQFMDGVSVFGTAKYYKYRVAARSGWNATLLYLFTKSLYVLNVMGQLMMLNTFLGGNYFQWGMQTASDVIHGREWTESGIFPRVILCDFTVRVLAQKHQHTVQCVIMMNMINEKLYLFLYFWFLFVGVITVVNFLYYLIVLSIPSMRAHVVLYQIDEKRKSIARRDRARFVHECLHPDGVLLLQFIREHVGGRVASELTNKLLQTYASEGFSSSSSDRSPSSPSHSKHFDGYDEKANNRDTLPLMPYHRKPHLDHYAPPPTKMNNSPYVSTPNRTHESAPPLEDFEGYPTLRMDETRRSPQALPRKVPPLEEIGDSLNQPDFPHRNSPTDV